MPERLDIANSRVLRRAFDTWLELTDRIIFDCSGVVFVDSNGLGAVVACLRRALERQGELGLFSLTPRVAMLFELTRINSLLRISPDLGAALRSFAGEEPEISEAS